MNDEVWHLASEPPDTDRLVMLRFPEHGRRSVVAKQVGYFRSAKGGKYAFRKDGPFRSCPCHPTRWRELTEEERDE